MSNLTRYLDELRALMERQEQPEQPAKPLTDAQVAAVDEQVNLTEAA